MSPSIDRPSCLCSQGVTLDVHVLERNAVERALTIAKGDKNQAAKLCGMSLKTLYAKIDRYGWRARTWDMSKEKLSEKSPSSHA